uniref:Putative H-N-H homing endonuclease n=1 Tax=Gloeotilopsis planctonica TaxID=34157 RepID=A0A1B2RZ81_9CHLO|nr:putative H-N-H homing endonuclease [Gloeotilopsis planctonica]
MLNIYELFIKYLIELEAATPEPKKKLMEKHHIVPKHAGGSPTGQVVFCSPENHTLAHFYRYLVYGEQGDWVCYQMRKNQKTTLRERSLLAVEKQKKLQINFWSSKWQSRQGKKGGKIGGIKDTSKQFAARQKVGLTFGSQGGLKNQSNFMKKALSRQTVWLYKWESFSFFLVIKPQPSFSKLIDILQVNTPNKTVKILKSSFYKVFDGQRRQMYGWQLWFIFL